MSNPVEQVVEALRAALTWEGRLNDASQLAKQGHRGVRECLTIKSAVLREVNAARAALAEMDRWEVVEGKADPSGGFWRTTDFQGDRPAILLVRKEEPK